MKQQQHIETDGSVIQRVTVKLRAGYLNPLGGLSVFFRSCTMDCQVHFGKSYFEISQPTIANTYVGELHHVYLYVYCAVCLIYCN